MTVLGNSSIYHSWDDATQKFRQIGVQKDEKGFLLLDGKDEVVSNRYISCSLTYLPIPDDL
jgi:hypothetical protein